MEHEIVENVKALCKAYNAKSLVLFGSRAKGVATLKSDFDFAVSGVDDFYGLCDAIDSIPTLHKIDLVNIDTCRNSLLLEEIKTYGCKIL